MNMTYSFAERRLCGFGETDPEIKKGESKPTPETKEKVTVRLREWVGPNVDTLLQGSGFARKLYDHKQFEIEKTNVENIKLNYSPIGNLKPFDEYEFFLSSVQPSDLVAAQILQICFRERGQRDADAFVYSTRCSLKPKSLSFRNADAPRVTFEAEPTTEVNATELRAILAILNSAPSLNETWDVNVDGVENPNRPTSLDSLFLR